MGTYNRTELDQRVFDQIFDAAAKLFLLDENQLEEIAKSLEDPKHHCDVEDAEALKHFAAGVRSFKNKVE
jgi:hypothetical protein